MLARLRKAYLAIVAFLAASAAVYSVCGADAESRAFDAADKSLRDGFYERAEKAFAAFAAKHPGSPRLPAALLLESQAAAAQGKHQIAIDLLATNIASAAGVADQFQFAVATNYFAGGRFDAAATNFAYLVTKYTNSALRLEATVGEARARFELKQWGRVADLLQNPTGVFQSAASQVPTGSTVLQGRLLLAEALLKQRKFAAAQQVAALVPESALTGESKWRREYLLAQAQFAAQQLHAALSSSSNLVTLAASTRRPALEAAAVALQGEILEALGQPEAAIASYQQNQRAGLPPERIREALFKIVELMIAQGQITNAQAKLESFIADHPREDGSDIVLLTLAELRLKQQALALAGTNAPATSSATAGTNLLALALADADKVVRDFTNSLFSGQAHFVRGWALLAQGRAGDSLAAFATAAESLPWSEAQAVARFKVADLEFQTGDTTNALRDYRRVIADYNSLNRVQAELVPRARYQILQASRDTRDEAVAYETMRDVVHEYPTSGLSERTLLLFGQVVDELGKPAQARKIFSEFLAHYANSPLQPEVELAIARTYESEKKWAEAVSKYDAWVIKFPTNANLARAEFNRAVANFQAGRETNALNLFTNFIARFPTNLWAARAQNWVGDFYYRARPEQFALAEANYQRVYQNTNWNVPELSDLRYSAQLSAGRAALMRLNFDDAVDYFTNMINDAACPEPLKANATFAYGDVVRGRPSTNGVEKYRAALPIYLQIPRFHPTDPIVPLAWCAIGNCYFELGTNVPTSDPQVPTCETGFDCALVCYAKVTNNATADLPARSQAEVGIGNVLRQQARAAQDAGNAPEAGTLLTAALDSYLNVVYQTETGDQPDPYWVKRAALEAASIAETQRKWDRALKLYLRLKDMIPVPDPRLEKKILNAAEQLELQKP